MQARAGFLSRSIDLLDGFRHLLGVTDLVKTQMVALSERLKSLLEREERQLCALYISLYPAPCPTPQISGHVHPEAAKSLKLDE